MTARLIAAAVLVLFLGVVGTFLAGALFGPREQTIAGQRPTGASQNAAGGVQPFAGNLGPWRVEGSIMLGDAAAYDLRFRLIDIDGRVVVPERLPTVRASMVDHGMGAELVRVQLAEGAEFRSSGRLSMAEAAGA